MEKVAIYARISTDILGQDVDRQLHEVRDYCQRMGYEIAEEYVDEGLAALLAIVLHWTNSSRMPDNENSIW